MPFYHPRVRQRKGRFCWMSCARYAKHEEHLLFPRSTVKPADLLLTSPALNSLQRAGGDFDGDGEVKRMHEWWSQCREWILYLLNYWWFYINTWVGSIKDLPILILGADIVNFWAFLCGFSSDMTVKGDSGGCCLKHIFQLELFNLEYFTYFNIYTVDQAATPLLLCAADTVL